MVRSNACTVDLGLIDPNLTRFLIWVGIDGSTFIWFSCFYVCYTLDDLRFMVLLAWWFEMLFSGAAGLFPVLMPTLASLL